MSRRRRRTKREREMERGKQTMLHTNRQTEEQTDRPRQDQRGSPLALEVRQETPKLGLIKCSWRAEPYRGAQHKREGRAQLCKTTYIYIWKCMCVCATGHAENCWLLSSTKANSRKQKATGDAVGVGAGAGDGHGVVVAVSACSMPHIWNLCNAQRPIICMANNKAVCFSVCPSHCLSVSQSPPDALALCEPLCGSHNLLFKHAKCCMQHAMPGMPHAHTHTHSHSAWICNS